MLCLSRKRDETVILDGGRIKITVIDIRGDKVRLGFEAPAEVAIHREEVWEAIQREIAREGKTEKIGDAVPSRPMQVMISALKKISEGDELMPAVVRNIAAMALVEVEGSGMAKAAI